MELLVILVIAVVTLAFTIKNLYYICQPNEVLIFAGSSRRLANGQRVGYRLVKGGSSLRMPLMERVLRMDLTNLIIDLRVVNAYSKGGIPLNVEGVANIKIAGEEPIIHNAIERLLGKQQADIKRLAKETLEGNLRGVLASLTPEQVNQDKVAFVRSLLEEAEEDLNKLGLVLDTLQIQTISDDVKYLDSIGRKQRADLLRDSRIGEAQAQAEASIQAAENAKLTVLAQINSEVEIARAEAQRRILDATTRRQALVAEVEAEIGARLIRTQADLAVQEARINQARQQLKADVVAPAEADCLRRVEEARAQAAEILEEGKALVEGLQALVISWQAAGPNARQIFLLQKLEPLLKTLAATVPEVQVEQTTVLAGGEGNLATQLAVFLEQLQATAGIDLKRHFAGGAAAPPPLPPA